VYWSQRSNFDFARRSLKKASEDAYHFALDALGGPSYLETSQFELIPIGEPDVLSNSTFYKDLFEEDPKRNCRKSLPTLLLKNLSSLPETGFISSCR
jgi:hypothetical protein